MPRLDRLEDVIEFYNNQTKGCEEKCKWAPPSKWAVFEEKFDWLINSTSETIEKTIKEKISRNATAAEPEYLPGVFEVFREYQLIIGACLILCFACFCKCLCSK